jgi:hypothetical protein
MALRLVSFTGHVRRLKELYKSLSDKLIAKTVAAEMYQRDAMSLSELECIQSRPTASKAAEELLKVVLQQASGNGVSVYECFMEALKVTNQHHIHLWISYPGSANIRNTYHQPKLVLLLK